MAARENPLAVFIAEAAALAAEVGQRGGGLTDIRQKLVEEPFFGRPLAARPEPSMAERLGWDAPGAWEADQAWNELRGRVGQAHEHSPQHDIEHDPGLDR